MLSDDRSMESIRQEALRWAIQLHSGEFSDADREAFFDWVLADPRHEAEFRAHQAVMIMGAELPRNVVPFPASAAPARSSRRWWRSPALAAVVLLALALPTAWFVVQQLSGPHEFVTGTGETRLVSFTDGSTALLNTRTRLQWQDESQERRVIFLEGEALFEVKADPNRPFRVVLDDSEIEVLGTRFNVYRKPAGEVTVSVLDGVVKVREVGTGADRTRPGWERELRANQRLAYGPAGLTREVQNIKAAAIAQWRDGVYEVENEPLPHVIEELMRYTDKRIVIRDARLADVRVGGALSTREVERTLERMEKLVPIVVERNETGFVLSYRTSERRE